MEDTYELFTIRTQSMPFINYSYLGIDRATRQAFVIDPAWDISSLLDLLDLHQATLQAILLTHSHYDHTNMVEKLEELSGASVYISRQEAEFYGFNSKRLVTVEDSEQIWVGNTCVTVLVTPGHTKGSVCYWSGNQLFSGDTVFIEGCGLCDGQGGSAEEMYYSIRRLLRLIPPHIKIYPGHSFGETPGQTMCYLQQWNLYLQIEDISDFVAIRNRKNMKLPDFK